MTERTTRRRMLGAGAAALAALGTWTATSKLRGRTKENGSMQNLASPADKERGVQRVLRSRSPHWVGDGFLVHGVMSPDGDPRLQSPFLLLDHAAPRRFEPTATRRGVGEHPHRGFETVTFAYRGEIEHRDSSGGGGIIGPGDVQWMTAASGVVHEELHSKRFAEEGGELEMVQLWVNLPARAKLSPPGYQSLLDRDFPRLRLGAAEARLVAGSLEGAQGPARTHTPMTLFDLRFLERGDAAFDLPAGFNSLVFSLEGVLSVGSRSLAVGELAVLERTDARVRVAGEPGARALVLGGEPIDEPVAAYGPFVMNTREQLMQAVRDYQGGKMGHL